MSDPNNERRTAADENKREWSTAMSAGIQLAITVLLFFLLGYWLDKKFSTVPWLSLVGFAVGFTVGLINFLKLFK